MKSCVMMNREMTEQTVLHSMQSKGDDHVLHSLHSSGKTVAKPRAVLTSEQAIEIFQCRPTSKSQPTGMTSSVLARKYRISEKAIRDIWNGRTWHRETLHLDPSRPSRINLPPGRPLGRKDSSSRRRSSHLHDDRPIERLSDSATLEPSASNRLDDPFHDDWPYWARAGDSTAGPSELEGIGCSDLALNPHTQSDVTPRHELQEDHPSMVIAHIAPSPRSSKAAAPQNVSEPALSSRKQTLIVPPPVAGGDSRSSGPDRASSAANPYPAPTLGATGGPHFRVGGTQIAAEFGTSWPGPQYPSAQPPCPQPPPPRPPPPPPSSSWTPQRCYSPWTQALDDPAAAARPAR